MTNLDLLSPTGALVISASVKIQNGSGSPLRVLALVANWRSEVAPVHSGRGDNCFATAMGATLADEHVVRSICGDYRKACDDDRNTGELTSELAVLKGRRAIHSMVACGP